MIHYLSQRLLYLFVRIIYSTYRFKYHGLEHKNEAKQLHPKGSILLGVWHGNVMGCLLGHAYQDPFLVMCSRSKDGDYAAYVSKKFKMIPVRGSSRRNGQDKGGKDAINEYITKIELGQSGGVTIDGPKGPREICKPGIMIMAKSTGCAVVPLMARPVSFWEMKKAWDLFQIPKPFTTIHLHYGKGFQVPPDATSDDIQHYCELMKQKLTDLKTILI